VSKQSIYLRLETRIASGSLKDVVARWRYGRSLLTDKAGRKQLPKGKIEGLIKEAADAGIKVSEREIQRRIKCAEVYGSEAEVRRASDGLGSWTALHEAGFPTFESTEPADLEAAGVNTGPPDEFEQLTLIPGAPAVLRVKGREPVELTTATITDFKAYCEQSAEITANFAKHDALLWSAYRAMLDGSDGDMDANAVEAWKRGTGEDDEGEAAA
jgi:hypothetical protein